MDCVKNEDNIKMKQIAKEIEIYMDINKLSVNEIIKILKSKMSVA